MEHKGTLPLETPRLLLRRFRPEDAEAMWRNWASDARVTKYLTWPPHKSAAVTRALLERWCAGYADPAYYQWAIVLKEPGEPIGSISAVRFLKGGSCAEIGYCIGHAWWGRGLTAEALGAVIAFFFETVGIPEVGACHDTRNPNSGRVMEKCGMLHRMTLPGQGTNNLGVCDLERYSITKTEYDGRKEENEP